LKNCVCPVKIPLWTFTFGYLLVTYRYLKYQVDWLKKQVEVEAAAAVLGSILFTDIYLTLNQNLLFEVT